MTTRSRRDFLKVQLIEMDRLLQDVGDHPAMSLNLKQRKAELEDQLAQLPVGTKEPRTVLFFSGNPVCGSRGIDASFAGRVLEPFQSMVMNQHANRWHGMLGARGKRRGENESRLLLTGLPRGSFGLELSKADNDELFEEDQLSETLAHITRLVESAGKSDEDFAIELEETSPRVIQNLRDFLKTVSEAGAGLRLESGDYRGTLTPEQATEAHTRVSNTVTKDDLIKERGTFHGLLLDDWRFNFVNEEGHKRSGKLDESITNDEATELQSKFFNKQCEANFLKTTVLFKNGRERTTFSLKELNAIMGE